MNSTLPPSNHLVCFPPFPSHPPAHGPSGCSAPAMPEAGSQPQDPTRWSQAAPRGLQQHPGLRETKRGKKGVHLGGKCRECGEGAPSCCCAAPGTHRGGDADGAGPHWCRSAAGAQAELRDPSRAAQRSRVASQPVSPPLFSLLSPAHTHTSPVAPLCPQAQALLQPQPRVGAARLRASPPAQGGSGAASSASTAGSEGKRAETSLVFWFFVKPSHATAQPVTSHSLF